MKDTKSKLNDEARITDALDEMRREAGESFSFERVNLAELIPIFEKYPTTINE